MNIDQFRQRFLFHLPVSSSADTTADRQAAVLLPVIAREEPCLLLTLRAAHLRHHPGQVSFPGGKRDPEDSSLKETALRETREELGISAQQIDVIGQLPAVSSQTGFYVTPFVAILPPDLPVTTDPDEVELAFEVPLSVLLQPDHFFPVTFIRQGISRQVWLSGYEKHFIWGMTAGIIRNLGKQILGK